MNKENVILLINKLEAINVNEEFAYEKACYAFLSLKELPVFSYIIAADTLVFRTRTHEKNDFFKTIDDIALTPKEFVKTFARCNRPFQQKFYCSENRPTSYIELVGNWAENKMPGEKIYTTIGMWKLKNNFKTIIVTTPDIENRVSHFDKLHGGRFDSHLKELSTDKREAHILFYRYLFNRFRKSAKHDLKTYIITTAYSNIALMYFDNDTHGIYYPSVPFKGEGVNFAINTEYATHNSLELMRVIRNEITVEIGDDTLYNFKETGISEASYINIEKNVIVW